jgi:hypothetical protein
MLSELRVQANHLRHGALLYIFELSARNRELLKQGLAGKKIKTIFLAGVAR